MCHHCLYPGINNGDTFDDKGQVNDAPSNSKYLAIDSYHEVSCALKDDGTVKCWGAGFTGFRTIFHIDNPIEATITVSEENVCAHTFSSLTVIVASMGLSM